MIKVNNDFYINKSVYLTMTMTMTMNDNENVFI